jgi:hypothetical protein
LPPSALSMGLLNASLPAGALQTAVHELFNSLGMEAAAQPWGGEGDQCLNTYGTSLPSRPPSYALYHFIFEKTKREKRTLDDQILHFHLCVLMETPPLQASCGPRAARVTSPSSSSRRSPPCPTGGTFPLRRLLSLLSFLLFLIFWILFRRSRPRPQALRCSSSSGGPYIAARPWPCSARCTRCSDTWPTATRSRGTWCVEDPPPSLNILLALIILAPHMIIVLVALPDSS